VPSLTAALNLPTFASCSIQVTKIVYLTQNSSHFHNVPKSTFSSTFSLPQDSFTIFQRLQGSKNRYEDQKQKQRNSIKLTCILCLSTSQGTYTMEPSVSPEKRKKLCIMISLLAFSVTQSFKAWTYNSNCVLPSFHKTFRLKAGFNQDGLYCFKDGS
jgi:hypothetical protein